MLGLYKLSNRLVLKMTQAPQAQGQAQPMQVDPAVQAFQDLRLELNNVTHALTAQGISGIVSKFDGNQKHFVNG